MPQVRILSLRPYRVFITDVRNTRYFFACIYLIFSCLGADLSALFYLCGLYCAWEVFDSHSLPRVKLVGVRGYDARQINTADKTVMDDKPLCSVLTRSLNRKDLDLVDKFLENNRCQRLHRHKLSYCPDKATR